MGGSTANGHPMALAVPSLGVVHDAYYAASMMPSMLWLDWVI
jgi:hypothetical protein